MLMWMQTVTDRSQSDVERVIELLKSGWRNFSVDEREEWLNGMKGALNLSDLQRIQNNTQLLSDVLELGLTVEDVPNCPDENFFKSLVDNTDSIRNSYMIHSSTPLTPSLPLNTYEKINDIEKILEDVYSILMNNFSYYCGNEIYAGDETGLLL